MLPQNVKGDLAVNLIIVAMLALVVFAIVFFIFTRYAGETGQVLSSCPKGCQSKDTVTGGCPVGSATLSQYKCPEGKICCEKIFSGISE